MASRIVCLLLLAVRIALPAQPAVDPSELPRVPATPPDQALETFHLKPGFRLELAAAEPLVIDPIALTFDEDGRAYVVEMRDYSERRPERLGRIRLLEDADGDGRFDRGTVFAADLPWPTAVTCWDGGVFVGATPDIFYLKDTDGDGVADVREVVFSGFASDYAPYATNKLNVQAMFNSFQWTLDNRIHGASGGSGGKVRRVHTPFTREWLRRAGVLAADAAGAGPVDLRGRDFSFDPRTLELRAESGGAQHGLSFDDAGRKFVCSNSDHIQQVVYEERYAGRNNWFSLPPPRLSIAADGPAAPVFRRSPDEPWRVIRTRWRVSGVVPGLIEGGGRPSGYFTGATGVTIYRGDALGEEYVGDAFIADCGSNLVHRKKLRPHANGLTLVAGRPADEQTVEFLASRDNWFRPVQFANAPDGALYICDMYREIIEHPWSLPESLKKHLDLNSGNERGRIYRVVPANYRQRPRARLGRLSSAELAELLGHPNGWHRDTASRLLYQRQEVSAAREIEQRLDEWSSGAGKQGSRTLGALHALHALEGMSRLKEVHVLKALRSLPALLRIHGLKLSERFLGNPSATLVETLRELAASPSTDHGDLSVDFQLAWTLGRLRQPERDTVGNAFLQRLYRDRHPGIRKATSPQDASAWFLPALLNSLGNDPVDMLRRAVLPPGPNRPGSIAFANPADQREMVTQFARLIGTRNNSAEVSRALELLAQLPVNPEAAQELRLGWEFAAALDGGLAESGASLSRLDGVGRLQPLLRAARVAALDSASRPLDDRLAAIKALSCLPDTTTRSNLLGLVAAAGEPFEIRREALLTLGRPSLAGFEGALLDRWPELPRAVRAEAIALFLKRAERIRVLLPAIGKGAVQATELDAAQQTFLRSHRDPGIREEALRVLGAPASGARQSAVESFLPALALKGSATAGRQIFQVRCAACHRLGGAGHPLGPDLASARANGREKLLVSIVDPNREVSPQFVGHLVETRDGESLVGLLATESETSVTLRLAGGVEATVARGNIASIQPQGKSLMPEGLEAGLSGQEMADLLEFIIATP